jgi:hypothetical protein
VDYQDAVRLLRMIRTDGVPVPVGWLSPIIVALIAAEAAKDSLVDRPVGLPWKS